MSARSAARRKGSRVGAMPTELTRYAVPGWGAGQLWTRDGVLLVHDFQFGDSSADSVPASSDNSLQPESRRGVAPNPSNSLLQGTRSDLAQRFAAFLAGEPDDFRDVAIDLEWATPFQHALATTLRPAPNREG